jgi:hypothetical protein
MYGFFGSYEVSSVADDMQHIIRPNSNFRGCEARALHFLLIDFISQNIVTHLVPSLNSAICLIPRDFLSVM